MRITELVIREPVVVENDATITETAALMASAGVGALIVVDHGRPVGMVTDRDLVTRGLAKQLPADSRVDSVMSMELVTLDADAEVEDLMHAFSHHAVRRVPILDGDRVVGIVSLDDMVVSVASEMTDLAKVLAAQIMFPHAGDEAPPPAVSG
jgi:CBS domain-containing protein